MATTKIKGRQVEQFTTTENGVVVAPITLSGKFLRDDNTWQTISAGAPIKNTITLGVSSNAVITTGSKIQARIISPYTGTIKKWRILSDLNTNAVVDIWKSTTGITPTNTNTITGTDKPTLVAQQTNSSILLTGWSTAINEGDLLQLEVESNSASRSFTIQLTIE